MKSSESCLEGPSSERKKAFGQKVFRQKAFGQKAFRQKAFRQKAFGQKPSGSIPHEKSLDKSLMPSGNSFWGKMHVSTAAVRLGNLPSKVGIETASPATVPTKVVQVAKVI